MLPKPQQPISLETVDQAISEVISS